MVLIYTDYGSFAEYVSTLGKKARKNLAYVNKHNSDLTYEKIEFDRELVKEFMALWEQQLIRGHFVQWAFPVDHVENLNNQGKILVFAAKLNGKPIAVHFIQLHENVVECHPPMYDKKYNDRYLAKYMWFNLIKYAIENNLPTLDMGGGVDGWREHIKNRANYPNPKYKWIYVPESVKDNPDLQPNYQLKSFNGNKILCLAS